MTETGNGTVLEMRGISKFFPGVKALDDVSLTLKQGEVLALIGENGAGKSTLMKVLGGVYQPDSGSILVDGLPCDIESVQKATALGIAFVHQELNLSDNLDVAANVFLGREPRNRDFLKLVDRKKINADTQVLLDKIELDCAPTEIVGNLSLGNQQMIEIAKALSINAKILIMDEPTSSLCVRESEQLFKVIKDLRNHGISVIYISHRMGEVVDLADRVIALRDGRNSGFLAKAEISAMSMIKLMVGRDVEKFYHKDHEATDIPVFECKDFIVPEHPGNPVNLVVRRGEILVMAGLVGAGRTELAHALFGITKALGGEVLVEGTRYSIDDPKDAIAAGIALVPEDRKQCGLVIEQSIERNITLAGLDACQKMKLIDFGKVRTIASRMAGALDVRMSGIEQAVENLSGGNQQKVVLAKWLSMGPRVLVLDEPTRGIDVVAKEEIYRLIEKLAAEGVAMLVISSEMQEVLGIADRIVVMHEGAISGELQKAEFSEEAVMKLAMGCN
ncbi:MAG: D-xylose ABC transporter ATP-binding protein [Treponema sp. GWB1_62_6]|nr:MAG: D-xylose ABC transporter ATP-binding protein [Treponema sp. GWA1_62_8]OHE66478.1 MAG: D-xylose ABC transporter ATP-binding protein [Treponema sp. GWC1_61_84]OHE67493.1 MAG: D-xylose ABC transporter ATP-binding protein [Treponema sp. GWB1_62_6]HCM29124.1 D-xylose ABC transporter ATP-binding protein [Treponema sp.]